MKKLFILDDNRYIRAIVETNDEDYPAPEDSTTVEPPPLAENQTCRFDEKKWIVEEKPLLPSVETEPSLEEYVIDLDYRLSLVELGV